MRNQPAIKHTASTKMLVINALFIALTLVSTWLINIRLPIMGNGGLIHLGNVPLFIGAILFGKKTGAIAGGFGMGLFDLFSGWTYWSPFTFVIVGTMGYIFGLIIEKIKLKHLSYITAVAAAMVIKIVGYYFTEVILYRNWLVPFGSVPGNVMQIAVAAVIAMPLAEVLKKAVSRI